MATYGFLSSMPPTKCGLATFADALAGSLATPEDTVIGVRVIDSYPDDAATAANIDVVATLVNGDRGALEAAAEALNRSDIAVIQHEYGIYGGRDGDEVLDLIDMLRVPLIAVLHTVLDNPTPHQKVVLEEVVRRADLCVVMSRAGLDVLRDTYDISVDNVLVIPHGVTPPLAETQRIATAPVVLTWGLIGPGKGIERGLRAMAHLRDMHPRPTYRVVGQTHPKVFAREGEAYRTRLLETAYRLGVNDNTEFYGEYLDRDALEQHIRAASVVLLPYDSTSQITSGVLAEAVASGIPVVATNFPHAAELLAGGAGIVVPHADPSAMARAVRWILTHPDEAAVMSDIGSAWGREAGWPAVGERYREAARGVAAKTARAAA